MGNDADTLQSRRADAGLAAPDGTDQDNLAQRLLGGSVRRTYDPVVDIDWDAPLDPAKLFLPPQVISLYDTDLWAAMTPAQRRELSRQELANVLSMGIWFENLLNRLLLRELMAADPTARYSHYALTEMGDECRHMMMFGKVIDRVEARPYWPSPRGRFLIGLLPLFLRGAMVWVGALVGEEIFDALQRRTLDDPQLQPLVSRTMRIHVTEEARHIGFARDALARRARTMSRVERGYTRFCVAVAGPLFASLLLNRHMYARAGLDGRAARRQARRSPHAAATLRLGTAGLAGFLDSVGLMGPLGKRLWGRRGMLA